MAPAHEPLKVTQLFPVLGAFLTTAFLVAYGRISILSEWGFTVALCAFGLWLTCTLMALTHRPGIWALATAPFLIIRLGLWIADGVICPHAQCVLPEF